MAKRKSVLIEKIDEIPTVEVIIEAVETPAVKIDFTSSGGLDADYFKKIKLLLEKHGYNSDKLILTNKPMGLDIEDPVKISKQDFKYDKEEVKLPKEKLVYSLVCKIDEKTKNEIKKLLETIPYVRNVL